MEPIATGDGRVLRVTQEDKKHQDTVQVICLHPDSELGIFATAGWDGEVKIWQLKQGTEYSKPAFGKSKTEQIKNFSLGEIVLSMTITKNNMIFIGCATGDVIGGDLSQEDTQLFPVVKHDAAIVSVEWVDNFNYLMTFSASYVLSVVQLGQNGFEQPVYINLPERTNCTAFSFPYLVVCSLYKTILIDLTRYNLNDLTNTEYWDLVDSQQSKITCVSINAESSHFAFGTIDAKVYFYQFNSDCTLRPLQSTNTTNNYYVQYLRKSTIAGSQQIDKFPVNCIDILYYRNNTESYINGIVGINKKISFCSGKTREQIGSIKTNKDMSNVTACKYAVLCGFKVIILATGNNWETGLESLMRDQVQIVVEIKELVGKNYSKYLGYLH